MKMVVQLNKIQLNEMVQVLESLLRNPLGVNNEPQSKKILSTLNSIKKL